MEVEHLKVKRAIHKLTSTVNEYEVITSGIGREAMAKTMMKLPQNDCTVLLGFGGIVGVKNQLDSNLQFGNPVEITQASLYGYEGLQFENGKPISTNAKTNLPSLASQTSDKFVKTTHLSQKTIVSMEDYTFMYLKQKQDFIVRIISDFLPHETEIDFFKEVEKIDFLPTLKVIEQLKL